MNKEISRWYGVKLADLKAREDIAEINMKLDMILQILYENKNTLIDSEAKSKLEELIENL